MRDMSLGQVISAHRRALGVTQEELAAYVGVTKASVSKWETGLSYPDITLLPVLAAYFDISIDALLGYSPQLTEAEADALYARLAASFAESPFEDVAAECTALTRRYYSCVPLLLRMAQLHVNHASLAASRERTGELLAEAVGLCQRVRRLSQDADALSLAGMLEALCHLALGRPERVFEVLGDTVRPRNSSAVLIAEAHRASGDAEKAAEIIQIELFQDVLAAFGGTLAYLQACAGDGDAVSAAFERAEGLAEAWNLRRLNPNGVAQLYLYGARAFLGADRPEEALAALEKYVDVCVHGFFPLRMRGDAFFDRIDGWLEGIGGSVPRSDRVIKESMLNDGLLDLALAPLRERPEFARLVGRLSDFISQDEEGQ